MKRRSDLDLYDPIPGQQIIDGVIVEDEPPAAGLAVVDHDVDRQLGAAAWERIAAAIPHNTMRAYQRLLFGRAGDQAAAAPWPALAWVPWCQMSGRRAGIDGEPAHEMTLAQWVSDLADAGVGAATIEQGIAAVRRLHREHGHSGLPDTGRALQVLRGYRRGGAAKQKRRAAPVTVPVLRAMLDATPTNTVIGQRDAMVLVVGVAAMLRRSELVALQLDQITVDERGLVLYIAESKTDKMARGDEVIIPRGKHTRTDSLALVTAWRELLAEQGHHDGALLRSVTRGGKVGGPLHPGGNDVNRIVKAAAGRAGLGDGYSGHGLRAGGATAAHLGGASIPEIMAQGRWTNPAQVVEYIRLQDRWVHNAAARMDL